MNVRKRLKQVRLKYGLTTEEVAKAMKPKIGRRTWDRWESGETPTIAIDAIFGLARAAGISVDKCLHELGLCNHRK